MAAQDSASDCTNPDEERIITIAQPKPHNIRDAADLEGVTLIDVDRQVSLISPSECVICVSWNHMTGRSHSPFAPSSLARIEPTISARSAFLFCLKNQ